MITPGIITDTAGFLLMIPGVRNVMIPSWSRRRFFKAFPDHDNGVYDIGPS